MSMTPSEAEQEIEQEAAYHGLDLGDTPAKTTRQPKAEAAPPELVPGDTVYLKSGSQCMSIEKITGEGVHVVWSVFDTKALARAVLPAHVLKKAGRS